MSLICGAPKFSIWDMKKFQGLTYRTFRTSVMLWNCVGTLLLPLKLNFYFTPVEIEILNDQPTLKSSRSPPYAATRNFCTLRIFYRTACSIFGTPKFSTCGMSLICGAPKFSIWDMKKFQGLTYRTFRTSVMLWNCVGTLLLPLKLNFYFSCWNWNSKWPTNRQKILFGGQPKTLAFFYPPTGAYRIFWFQHF